MFAHISNKTVHAILILAGAIAIGACAQPPKAQSERIAKTDDGHGLHTINNARLRAMMDELKAMDFEKICDEMAGQKQSDDRIEKVASTAATLAADARMIPYIYKNLEMTEESRRVFDHEAIKLQEKCAQLSSEARRRNTKAMRSTLDEIISTCNACHASFRGPNMAMARQHDLPYQ